MVLFFFHRLGYYISLFFRFPYVWYNEVQRLYIMANTPLYGCHILMQVRALGVNNLMLQRIIFGPFWCESQDPQLLQVCNTANTPLYGCRILMQVRALGVKNLMHQRIIFGPFWVTPRTPNYYRYEYIIRYSMQKHCLVFSVLDHRLIFQNQAVIIQKKKKFCRYVY